MPFSLLQTRDPEVMELEGAELENEEESLSIPKFGRASKGNIDFVLVWRDTNTLSHGDSSPDSEERKKKQDVFESNLLKEGLELEYEPPEPSGLNFVKIRATVDVLKRYAEILKLRLPMKKFEHIKEIRVDSYKVPLLTDVVQEIGSWANKLKEPFMWNRDRFKLRTSELTATFSRDREYLFDVNRPDFFTQSTRSRIIEFILKRKRISEDKNDDFAFGIDRCLNEGVYEAAYPLHDGSYKKNGSNRHALYNEWGSFKKIFKLQPLDAIRDYYGVKIALYFAWLGFYTNLLILPSLAGLCTVLYGYFTLDNDIPSQEVCGDQRKICPACDYFCDYWSLDEICLHNKAMYLFDNSSTVIFAVFMSFWTALFLEFWKKYSVEITHRWDVTGFSPEEEHPRPEYLEQLKHVNERTINFITQTSEPRVPYWSRKIPGIVVSVSVVLVMVLVVAAAVFGVILYRMSMIVALSLVDEETIKSNASLFISSTGAGINLIAILIVNQVYGYLAVWLTELELNRTQTEFDDSLSLKIYLLQFVNYYASIFYIAFMKGKFVGYPANYNRILGYRQEECAPGGCFMEVCVQMAIIFVGKQFLLSIVEYQLPRLWKIFNTLQVLAGQAKKVDKNSYPQWIQDFKLVEWGKQGLFYEYLEMVIQYGFITIFATAFPLAPLFALINNVFELRLDAKKLLVYHRRPVAYRVRDIGVWLQILESLGRIAVLTNGLIIAFTSSFIPKMVYTYGHSPDQSLRGYVNFTLSTFDPGDFEHKRGLDDDVPDTCSYYDFRHPPNAPNKYQITEIYWHVLAARFAFVFVFQNVVMLSVMAVRWIVPNVSTGLKDRMRREAYLTNEIVIRTELLKATGKIDADGRMIDNGLDNSDIDRKISVETHIKPDQARSCDQDHEEVRYRKGLSLPTDGTGDITDGHIVL